MHALVSTPRFLLLVDLATGSVDVVESDRPEYYGISWFPGSSEVVLSHSGVDHADIVDIATYATSEVGWVSRGAQEFDLFLSAPHQLLCAPDGRAVVTNTGRNRVQVVELEVPGRYHEIGLSEARWDRLSLTETIGDHLNSVFLNNDVLYVIAHGYRKGSHLLRFRYPELSRISADRIPNVTGVHNVVVIEDGMIVGCHSETGGLIELKTGKLIWESGAPVYTRGLAVSEECYFVGESEITSRENRVSCPGGIWIVDRGTLETQNYIPLGSYGAVHEVRLVDVPDLAHHRVPLAGGVDAIARRAAPGTDEVTRAPAAAARADRLRLVRMSADAAARWSGFTAVLGQTATLEEAWKRVGEGLALFVSDAPAAELSAEYRLAEDGLPSHVSVVAGYEGGGDDANMDAFLIHTSGTVAALSAWRHAGDSWVLRPDPHVPKLPRRGTLRVVQSGGIATVSVDSRRVGSYPLQRPGPSRMGIRAMNAAFRPA